MNLLNKTFVALGFLLSGGALTLLGQPAVRDSLDVEKALSVSPSSLLTGRVSGVHIGKMDGGENGALSTLIRGLNSLRGDSQPLWVVDGVILSNGMSRVPEAFWQKGGVTSQGDAIPDYSGQHYAAALNDFAFLDAYEIESIEVLKDLAAVGRYGADGANGVIVIHTRRACREGKSLRWNSSFQAGIPVAGGKAFHPGFGHHHSIFFSELKHHAAYNVSGWFRDNRGTISGVENRYGGLNMGFESNGHSIFGFGVQSRLSFGRQSIAAGTAYYGRPSYTMLARYPDAFPENSLSGWLSDYDDDVQDFRTVTSAWLTVNLGRLVVWKTSVGIDFQNNNRSFWYGEGTSFGAAQHGAAAVISSALFNYNWKTAFTFKRYVDAAHRVEAEVSAEGVGYRNNYSVMNGTDFDLPSLRAKGLSSAGSRALPNRFKADYNRLSATASVAYDWEGRIGFNALMLADFSWKYASRPQFFPAASAFIDFRKWCLPESTVMTQLRFTGGWGKAGREASVPYELFWRYLNDAPSAGEGEAVYFDGLHRLTSAEWNAGVELGLWNRVTLRLKYYDKRTEDAFSVYHFGKIAGDYWIRTSSGKIISETKGVIGNRGMEMDVDTRLLQRNDWDWTLFARAAYNVSEVMDNDYGQMPGLSVVGENAITIHTPGRSPASLFGYQATEDGAYVDQNADGVISDADKVILGASVPAWTASLGTTLRFRAFTLDVLFDGAAGFSIANLNRAFEDRRDALSSEYVERGDYFRLSHVSLSYQIPVRWKWVKDLSAFVGVSNLFTVTGYSGWTPDVNCFGNNVRSFGADYGCYPAARRVTLGVKANF